MAKPVEKEIVDFAEFTGNTAAAHSQSVLLVSPRAEAVRLVEMEGPQATILTDSLSPFSSVRESIYCGMPMIVFPCRLNPPSRGEDRF
jgi:hypothetical protein